MTEIAVYKITIRSEPEQAFCTEVVLLDLQTNHADHLRRPTKQNKHSDLHPTLQIAVFLLRDCSLQAMLGACRASLVFPEQSALSIPARSVPPCLPALEAHKLANSG